jgi:hypothetical protein
MHIAYQGDEALTMNDSPTVVFVVAAAIIAVIAGGVSAFCIARGGNVEWSTRFWIFVKVACHFK